MGYHASGSGYITLRRHPFEKEFEKLNELIEEYFYCSYSDSEREFFVDYDGNYHGDDDYLDMLNEVNAVCNVESGEIVFSGDDDCHWRFVFLNGKWVEDLGRVVYDMDEDYIYRDIKTPIGVLRIKTGEDDLADSPGVSVSFVGNDGRVSLLARTEYDCILRKIVTRCYTPDSQSIPVHTTTQVMKHDS